MTDDRQSGFCTHCGHALHPGDQFCGGCGTDVEAADVTPPDVAAETADPEIESTSSATPAAPPPALPAGPSASDPGWHADPFGRFEYRYSDGAQWTDQVSINGVQSTDPVVQAPPAPLSGAPPLGPVGDTEPAPPEAQPAWVTSPESVGSFLGNLLLCSLFPIVAVWYVPKYLMRKEYLKALACSWSLVLVFFLLATGRLGTSATG